LKQQNKKILAYWLTPDKSFLWLVAPSHFDLFTLAGGSEIEQKARDYNQTLQGPENPQDLEQQGQSLYALLVEPVQKLIPRDAKLVIVPDGGLTKLNFETLRVPHPVPHFWIQDAELEIASSSSLFIRGRGHVSLEARSVLLIGDPIQASDDYPALTHASEELKRVEAHFAADQETVFSREKATPSAYLSSHPERFGLIHFVTHGTASELSPLESAIILSRQVPSPQGENSFKLYARDIVTIPLKADIVTISACYGLGKRTYSGEGLVGLAWAFLRAGAHQVVAGLWEVDDRAAVELMDDFYTGLQKWKSTSKALRLAKLKMVGSESTYSRPYYWASLQVYTGS
jgi:CHAT domain-containing protein